MTLESLLLFVTATLAVNFSPGPSNLFVTTISAAHGLRAGLVSVAGMSAGVLIHVFAATAGVSAVIAASPTAFVALKIVGAVYLVYIGVQILRVRHRSDDDTRPRRPEPAASIFRRGLMVDLLSPKIGIFFFAFLPQFVPVGSSHAFGLTLLYGFLFVLIGGVVNSGFAILTTTSLGRFRSTGGDWLQRWLPGGLLISLGIRLAFVDLR